MRMAAGSSTCEPKVMVPKQARDTVRSVCCKVRICIEIYHRRKCKKAKGHQQAVTLTLAPDVLPLPFANVLALSSRDLQLLSGATGGCPPLVVLQRTYQAIDRGAPLIQDFQFLLNHARRSRGAAVLVPGSTSAPTPRHSRHD